MAHAEAVAGSSIFVFNLLFFFGFMAEACITYEKNMVISIGEGEGFGLTPADFSQIFDFDFIQPDCPGRRGKRSRVETC